MFWFICCQNLKTRWIRSARSIVYLICQCTHRGVFCLRGFFPRDDAGPKESLCLAYEDQEYGCRPGNVLGPRGCERPVRHGLLDGRHLSGRKHCVLGDLWLEVLEQFVHCWVHIRLLVLVGTASLRVNCLFCRDIGLWTRSYTYVWSQWPTCSRTLPPRKKTFFLGGRVRLHVGYFVHYSSILSAASGVEGPGVAAGAEFMATLNRSTRRARLPVIGRLRLCRRRRRTSLAWSRLFAWPSKTWNVGAP